MVFSEAPEKDGWDGAGLEAKSLSIYLLIKQLPKECGFNQKRKENVGGCRGKSYFSCSEKGTSVFSYEIGITLMLTSQAISGSK